MDVGQWQNSSAAMCELDNLQLRANQVGFYSFVSLFVAQCELHNLQLRANQVGFSRFFLFLLLYVSCMQIKFEQLLYQYCSVILLSVLKLDLSLFLYFSLLVCLVSILVFLRKRILFVLWTDML